jgi:hypothetical protein
MQPTAEQVFFRVLWNNPETLFWDDLAGAGGYNELHRAIHAAQAYHEQSGLQTRVVNARAAILFDSWAEMHCASKQKTPVSKEA